MQLIGCVVRIERHERKRLDRRQLAMAMFSSENKVDPSRKKTFSCHDCDEGIWALSHWTCGADKAAVLPCHAFFYSNT
jgi:hypothetical protein